MPKKLQDPNGSKKQKKKTKRKKKAPQRPTSKVLLTSAAMADLKKVGKRDSQSVSDAIRDLGKAPRGGGCKKLTKDPKGRWRKRVGKYRIVYEIDDAGRIVIVVVVRGRADACKAAKRR